MPSGRTESTCVVTANPGKAERRRSMYVTHSSTPLLSQLTLESSNTHRGDNTRRTWSTLSANGVVVVVVVVVVLVLLLPSNNFRIPCNRADSCGVGALPSVLGVAPGCRSSVM